MIIKKLLVIGKNSFIGSHIIKSGLFNCYSISHEQVHDFSGKGFDYVINTAIHPDFIHSNYAKRHDFDLLGFRIAEAAGARYIMLSTRKVYGSCCSLHTYTENSATNPCDFYSENKLISEESIRSMAGDTTIIFRGSNIFGEEPYRKSFMGFCLTQLIASRSITYDIHPNIVRDFLFIKDACRLVKHASDKDLSGTYNLSYGQGTRIDLIAQRLLRGFGCGNFLQTSTFPSDQFVLNNLKLLNALSLSRQSLSDPLHAVEDIAANIAKRIHKKLDLHYLT